MLAILWTLLGYFGLFDLGLGSAVTNRIAILKEAAVQEREEVFWTALLLNAALGTVGALALWGGGALIFRRFVGVPTALASEVALALPWMSLAFPLLLTSSVLSGALMGREKFLEQNLIRVGEGLLIQVVPLIAALRIGPQLPVLVGAVLAVRLLGTGVRFTICARALPVGLAPRPRWSLARPLFVYGGWVTITSIVGPLMDGLDRVIIGAVSGITAVTHYTVPFSLASRLTVLPGSLSSAMFPRFSSAPEAERRALMYRAVRTLAALLTPLVLLGILTMAPFLSLWISPAFSASSAAVGEVLLLGMWANCLAYVPFSFLQGAGRPDLPAWLHLMEVVPYFLVLWLALARWGAVGAALAWSLRATVDAVLQFRYSGADRRLIQFLAMPAVSLLATAASVQLLPWNHLARWGVGALLFALSCYWLWLRAAEEVRHVLQALPVGELRRVMPNLAARSARKAE